MIGFDCRKAADGSPAREYLCTPVRATAVRVTDSCSKGCGFLAGVCDLLRAALRGIGTSAVIDPKTLRGSLTGAQSILTRSARCNGEFDISLALSMYSARHDALKREDSQTETAFFGGSRRREVPVAWRSHLLLRCGVSVRPLARPVRRHGQRLQKARQSGHKVTLQKLRSSNNLRCSGDQTQCCFGIVAIVAIVASWQTRRKPSCTVGGRSPDAGAAGHPGRAGRRRAAGFQKSRHCQVGHRFGCHADTAAIG